MGNKQTAVEWLYEKMSYVTWMRNRDEISPGMADEWRKHYLDVAKEMEKQQIIDAHYEGQQLPCEHRSYRAGHSPFVPCICNDCGEEL